jgi:hypothetical protein
MNPEEMKAALIKMNDDAWHKRNLDAAYEPYADDIVVERIPFPPADGRNTRPEQRPHGRGRSSHLPVVHFFRPWSAGGVRE